MCGTNTKNVYIVISASSKMFGQNLFGQSFMILYKHAGMFMALMGKETSLRYFWSC